MQVVYIDVLFIINLIVNYFILLAAASILHRPVKRLRLLAGAFLGAVYSCLMFFPQLGFLYTAGLKIIISAAIVAVSYKHSGIKNFLKLLLTFYITSMLFGGIIYAVQYFLSPPGLDERNGVIYMDISPLMLILSSAGCYILISLISKYFHRNVHTNDIYSIKIEVDGKTALLPALLDNGNDLRDAISGCPVIIVEYNKVKSLIPPPLHTMFSGGTADAEIISISEWNKRVRMIPFGSIGSVGGILPAFRPDILIIESAQIRTADVIVAVTKNRLSDEGDFFALLNPQLFHDSKKVLVPV